MTDGRLSLAHLDPELVELVDEISEQFARGEEPDLEACCRKYPHAEQDLRRLFPAIAALAALGDGTPQVSLSSQGSSEAVPRTLGDFRIIRELGRGGMGIVYEAEQISLDRRVALKVLPLAGVLDDRQLARFKNESKAAASLRHSHIVGVHAVGVDRGVHFYAMELIEGRSLAAIIEQLREEGITVAALDSVGKSATDSAIIEQDTVAMAADNTAIATAAKPKAKVTRGFFERIAQLGIEAAEALAYAHEQGLLHRDVKPANLLLDQNGHIFITDFGLARMEAGAGLSMTGDLVGTLRYMSPEQARGDTVLDQRTDIYSLGLVLYELITLRPAFDARDRHRLLKEMMEGQPTAPRRINADVPHDLETIVLKAIAQQRDSRFATAQELADDLRRFVERKPIRARRISRLEIAISWVRRNPLVTLLGISLLGLLTAAAIIGPLVAVQQRRLTRQANRQNVVLSVSAAYRFWEEGDVKRTRELLEPIVSRQDNLSDLTFAAQYLWEQSESVRSSEIRTGIDGVREVAYASEGQHLFMVAGKSLSRWDVASRRPVLSRDVIEHGWIASFAHLPAASLLAIGTSTGLVQLLNPDNFAEIARFHVHSNLVTSLAFSPDGAVLASTDEDGVVRLCSTSAQSDDTNPGVIVGRHETSAADVRFSPSGEWLVSVGDDQQLKAWDLNTYECKTICQLEVMTTAARLAISPDGEQVAVGFTGGVDFFETRSWTRVHRILSHRTIRELAYSPNGRLLALADHTLVRIIDCKSFHQIEALPVSENGILSLGFSPKGDILFTATRDAIRFWPAQDWYDASRSYDVAFGVGADFLQTDSNSRTLVGRGKFQHGTWGGDLGILDSVTNQVDYLVSDGASYYCVERSPVDPHTFAAVSYEDGLSRVELWDLKTRTLLAKMEGHSGIAWHLAFSPDGRWLATTDAGPDEQAGALILWDVRRQAGHTIRKGKVYNGVAFSPDSRFLAVASGDWVNGQVEVIDVGTGESRLSLPSERMGLAVQFSPDSKLLAFASWSGQLDVWELKNDRYRFSAQLNDRAITHLAFNPDSRTLAAGGLNQDVILWDVDTSMLLARLPVEASPTILRFAHDGQSLLAGLINGSVRTWHVSGERTVHYRQERLVEAHTED